MADRIRKQGAFNSNRPTSIDEMNQTQQGIMLSSTNDSRIKEVLPNVNKQAIFNQTKNSGFGAIKIQNN